MFTKLPWLFTILQVVLRRLKAYHVITTLQTTVDEMLSGAVSALLLPEPEFKQRLHKVAMAVADLADLALLPQPGGPTYFPSKDQQQSQAQQQQQKLSVSTAALGNVGAGGNPSQADPCVLNLLLAFRIAEQLVALIDIAAVHASRLQEQAKLQDEQQLPGEG
jgi:hypothetical protein